MDQHGVPATDVREAARRLHDGPSALLVDVRERDEFAALRAPGVVLIPLSEFGRRYEELPRDRSLFIVCAAGSRSAMVTDFLLRQGYPDVSNVSGGMGAWRAAGLETRSGPPAPGEGEQPVAGEQPARREPPPAGERPAHGEQPVAGEQPRAGELPPAR